MKEGADKTKRGKRSIDAAHPSVHDLTVRRTDRLRDHVNGAPTEPLGIVFHVIDILRLRASYTYNKQFCSVDESIELSTPSVGGQPGRCSCPTGSILKKG